MTAHRKMSKLDAEFAHELIEGGETVKAVCARFGVTYKALYAAFKRAGIERSRERDPLTETEKYYINQNFLEGLSVAQICDKWNIKKSRVYEIVADSIPQVRAARKEKRHALRMERRSKMRARRNNAVRGLPSERVVRDGGPSGDGQDDAGL